jgi:hypothetical protein
MASGVCDTKLWLALDTKKVCTTVMVELAKRVHMITICHSQSSSLDDMSTVIGHHATIGVQFAMKSAVVVQSPELLYRFMIMEIARLESNLSALMYPKICCQTPLFAIPNVGDKKRVIIIISKLSLAAMSSSERCIRLYYVSKS